MAGDKAINIRIDDDFAEKMNDLPGEALGELRALAITLERDGNPYSPDIQEKCILLAHERLEYPLGDGYVLIWKIHCESFDQSLMHCSLEVYFLDILTY